MCMCVCVCAKLACLSDPISIESIFKQKVKEETPRVSKAEMDRSAFWPCMAEEGQTSKKSNFWEKREERWGRDSKF